MESLPLSLAGCFLPESSTACVATVDIPQADDLDAVRELVRTVAEGAAGPRRGARNRAELIDVTRQSPRHVQYRVRAAVLLGFLSEERCGEGRPASLASSAGATAALTVTPAGARWLALEPRSDEEKLLLRLHIRSMAPLASIAFDLFADRAPEKVQLAQRIEIATRMARTTAVRRAQTLLAWRRRAFARQLDLFECASASSNRLSF